MFSIFVQDPTDIKMGLRGMLNYMFFELRHSTEMLFHALQVQN
jgi:hypothetical protein